MSETEDLDFLYANADAQLVCDNSNLRKRIAELEAALRQIASLTKYSHATAIANDALARTNSEKIIADP